MFIHSWEEKTVTLELGVTKSSLTFTLTLNEAQTEILFQGKYGDYFLPPRTQAAAEHGARGEKLASALDAWKAPVRWSLWPHPAPFSTPDPICFVRCCFEFFFPSVPSTCTKIPMAREMHAIKKGLKCVLGWSGKQQKHRWTTSVAFGFPHSRVNVIKAWNF